MDMVKIRREAVKRSIDMNPVDIEITRTVYEDDGAGGKRALPPVLLPPQTVRIFLTFSNQARDVSNEAGQMYTHKWGLLAAHDADIKKGDVFIDGDRKFKVKHMPTPVGLKGAVVSLQAELEEVE